MDPVAHDAVVEAMADTFPHAMDRYAEGGGGYTVLDYFRFVRLAMSEALDAALGVTYTPPCPECAGSGVQRYKLHSAQTSWSARDCPSCKGSGRSAPRLALIDLVPRDG